VEAVKSAVLPADFTWAPMIPELIVSDIAESVAFWRDLLGFRVVYERPEERFVFLDLGGAQIMLEQRDPQARQWISADLQRPLGRGVNFQTEIADLGPLLVRLREYRWPLYMDVEEKWYEAGLVEVGVRQCLVQDPDGYLVRLSQPLGRRPAGEVSPS
jgi:catechol 2,3-dioxygenase-like lactoylglutathione lyase family enzyme